MKKVIILLALMFNAALLHAGNGDLIVNGNVGVGVGTATPAARLHLYNTGGAAASFVLGEGLAQGNVHAFMNFDTTGYGTLQIGACKLGIGPGNTLLQPGGGKVGIGTTNLGTSGNNALIFGAGFKPSGLSDVAGLNAGAISGVTELRCFDESGNVTVLSAHAADAPDFLYDIDDGLPMIVREIQYFLGYVRYTNKTRASRLSGMTDAEKQMLSSSERTCVFRETFEGHETRTGEKLTKLVWEEEQALIKQTKDAERQAQINAKAELTAAIEERTQELSIANGKTKTVLQTELDGLRQKLGGMEIPEEYVIKPIPPRIQSALANR